MRWSDWAHVMCSTRGHWLPGDPRGFRNRGHRVHSSGDYRTPPPETEHAGLRAYAKSISGDPVRLRPTEQAIVGERVLRKLHDLGVPVATLAVDAVHLHVLMRVDESDAARLLGRAKQAASHALRANRPGAIWGRSSHVVRMRSQQHGAAVKRYILAHPDAWVWAHSDRG